MKLFFKKAFILILSLVILLCFFACTDKKAAEHSFFALDTVINIKCSTENARKIEELLVKYEKILSVTDENSEVYKLNHAKTSEISPELSHVIMKAMEISEKTDGAYNFAIYPLVYNWGFTTKNYKVLSENEIKSLLPKTDYTKLKLYDNTISAPEGFMLDFGGIAKGYLCDMAVELLKKSGEQNALISMGGNVYALGSNGDKPWKIAIRDPFSEKYAGVLSVCNKAVVTSGDYERFFEKDGKKYHHIINPETGYPAENSLKSVTVVSENATLADGLSTALYVMGYEKAMEFYEKEKSFDAIFIFDDGKIYVTENLRDSFTEN